MLGEAATVSVPWLVGTDRVRASGASKTWLTVEARLLASSRWDCRTAKPPVRTSTTAAARRSRHDLADLRRQLGLPVGGGQHPGAQSGRRGHRLAGAHPGRGVLQL